MSRRSARKKAFIIVYQISFRDDFVLEETYNDILSEDDEELFEKALAIDGSDKEFIYTLASGVYQNLGQLDGIIDANCVNWTFDRLNKVDVAILRMAIYEMLYLDDIPNKVTINEAVELAKMYGSEESSNFINGMLGKVSKMNLQKQEVQKTEIQKQVEI